MIAGLVFLGLAAAVGVFVWLAANDWEYGLAVTGIIVAIVVAVWLLVAFPISTYNRNSCRNIASGYGLDYDWSIRNDCRLRLPTGQLVPESRVRITSDGEIIAEGE